MKKSKFFLVGLILFFVAGSYAAIEVFRVKRLVGASSRLSLSTTKYERIINLNKEILVLGDSLAYGVGASKPENSFVGLLAKQLNNKSIKNEAEIGETTKSLKDTIDSKISGRYEKIFIIIGANDIIRINIDVNESASNLDYIINKSSQSSDEVILVTTANIKYISLTPSVLSALYGRRADIIRQKALNLEKKYPNFRYVDFYSYPISKYEYKELEAKDGYHLNDEGFKALVNVTLSGDY